MASYDGHHDYALKHTFACLSTEFLLQAQGAPHPILHKTVNVQCNLALWYNGQYNLALWYNVQYNLALWHNGQYNLALWYNGQYNLALWYNGQYNLAL